MSARLYVGDGSGPAARPQASTTVMLRMAVAPRTRWPATGLAAAPQTQFGHLLPVANDSFAVSH